jgi:acetolactate synthase-1/2/3 large subunit
MNGGDVLCLTLLDHGIDTCFANPGTSEMHFVASLDEAQDMRCILGLFEGVVTGAADGYARMADRPAATLLHTGPGLANGLANLHNARRARSAILNIVGDHARDHLPYDAPLTTDIESLAGPMSDWVGRVGSARSVQQDTSMAIAAARTGTGRVATLILPADAAWGTAGYEARNPVVPDALVAPSKDALDEAARHIRSGRRCLLLLGGRALRSGPMREAARIAAALGVGVLAEQANARCQKGRGSFAPQRIEYVVDKAVSQLEAFDVVILAGARAPVSFFKYPDKPHVVTREDTVFVELTGADDDHAEALRALREVLRLPATEPPLPDLAGPVAGSGPLDMSSLTQTVAATLPEGAIVCDEAISYSHAYGNAARAAASHDLLQLTGGAIGIGPSLAVGAAVACPDRPVLSLQADGSALYTIQALWTQAREGLNVVTVILSNRRYQSLYGELANLGRTAPGRNASTMLNLDNPALDWISIARGFGVRGTRVDNAENLAKALTDAYRAEGPVLIEAVLAD